MQKITQDALQDLMSSSGSPKVTIYVPLEATASPPHMSENQIRVKNLSHRAKMQLEAAKDTTNLGKKLDMFIDEHAQDTNFWRSQSHGLLVCAAPGYIKTFSLPVDTEEYIAVDDTFHLAPVLALMHDARDYYVLALAQQHPKLFRGDMYGLNATGIELPQSVRLGLGIDEANQQSENQGSATGSSLNTGWFNGRGGARDPQDVDRLRYFHMIDKILMDKTDRSIPLILAGVDAETAEYRDITKYPVVLNGAIAGNHTGTRLEDLFAKAYPIVLNELVMPEHAAALDEYQRICGANPNRVAQDKASILQAAEQGRIDKLLAAMIRRTTDTVQDKVESVLRITFPGPADSKTLNNLAAKVWHMSGKVIGVLPNEMPGGAPMVARLRY